MSYLLRHHPPVALDKEGYLPVSALLSDKSIKKYNISDIEGVVNSNDKKRF